MRANDIAQRLWQDKTDQKCVRSDRFGLRRQINSKYFSSCSDEQPNIFEQPV